MHLSVIVLFTRKNIVTLPLFLSLSDKCDKMVKESGKSFQKLFALHRESSKKTIFVRWFARNHERVRTRMTDGMMCGSIECNDL